MAINGSTCCALHQQLSISMSVVSITLLLMMSFHGQPIPEECMCIFLYQVNADFCTKLVVNA